MIDKGIRPILYKKTRFIISKEPTEEIELKVEDDRYSLAVRPDRARQAAIKREKDDN